ncbi:MAG: SMC family ATPase [Lachnospiraceae bacterium]|nr:SMC family ATPase [Lachnospiraceae bacterium]
MKPIQIIMSAFGSYGKEVKIDFSTLGGELFLITGDTGAGKTTIFDAIMYALYGRTSGGERDGSMMRSQFASPEAKTFVRYQFFYGNKVYQVERNPEYSIEVTLKNGNVKTRKVPQNVELTLPDGSIFPGKKTETDAKIEEIIGLSSEQFTQMAMIAQGDFLKLIYAKSDERKKIFTKLFGTVLYNKIQEELRRYSNAMDDAIEENRRSSEQDFNRKILPAGLELDMEDMQPLEVVNAYLSYGKMKEKEADDACKDNKKIMQQLHEQMAKAEVIEKHLAETKKALDKNKKEQQELKEQGEKLSISLALYDKIKKWIELCKQEELYKETEKLLNSHKKQKKTLDTLQKNWEKATNESIRCLEIYNAKYQMFLQEQAGILAMELKDNMPCPVCGSLSHPNPARLSKEAVSEQEVNMAKERHEQAENLRQEAENSYRIKAESIKREWDLLVERFLSVFAKKPTDIEKADRILEDTWRFYKASLEEYSDIFVQSKEWERLYRSKSDVQMEAKAEKIYQEMLSKDGRRQGELESKKSQEKELIKRLEKEEKQYQKIVESADFSSLKRTYQEAEGRQRILERQKQMLHTANTANEDVRKRLQAADEKADKLQQEDAIVKILYKTANGRLAQSVKMDLETYVQRQYFRQIIRQANKRFLVMTNQQFMLQIKEEITGKGKNEGLDLQVYSLVTGSIRDIKTLSGGESFLAALSMALGLSDIVQQNTGGIHLDMMFIDEGFGSLDGESRKKAIEVLDELSGGHRMIGIISHVTELKEQMEKKLLVTRNEKGSSICWENI